MNVLRFSLLDFQLSSRPSLLSSQRNGLVFLASEAENKQRESRAADTAADWHQEYNLKFVIIQVPDWMKDLSLNL